MRYAPREYRNLYLRRSRVALVGTVLLDYLFFVLNYRQLLLSPLFLSISTYSTLYATTCIRSYRPLSYGPLPRPALSVPLARPPPRTSSPNVSSARSSHPPRARRDPLRSRADEPRCAPHPARRSGPPRRWCRRRKRPFRRARTRHTPPGQGQPRPGRGARSPSGSRGSSPACPRGPPHLS